MGGRGKKFGERKQRVPRPPKPPKAKKARATRVRTSRRTKEQILFFTPEAQKAINKAQAEDKKTVRFEALTGKRVRANSERVRGNVGGEKVAGFANLDQISIPVSKTDVPIDGKGNLLNVHNWHKGTSYTARDARPFRVQLLKNNKFMINPDDVIRFAHYLATGGDTKTIRVTYTLERMTNKKIAELQAAFRAGKITKERMNTALDRYEMQLEARTRRRELGGDRTTVPTRRGGTTGNRTGETRRSEPAPRGKRTKIYNPEATTGTRKYPAVRKSRQTEASKAREAAIIRVPASQAGRDAQSKSAKKGKRKGSSKKSKKNNT